jgi:hypothetical protein
MALTTYAELKTSVADFLNRTDLTSAIPTFISLAEADFNRKIRHWRMEKRSTAVIDSQYTSPPTDFLEPIRLSMLSGNTSPLEPVSQSQMMEQRQLGQNTSGTPRFYAITDGSIEVYPNPNSDTLTLEMVYYGRPTALSDVNTSNWLLTYYPDAYLYGALVHSAPYLADDSRIQVWASLLNNSISGINSDNESAKYGGVGLKMKARSY